MTAFAFPTGAGAVLALCFIGLVFLIACAWVIVLVTDDTDWPESDESDRLHELGNIYRRTR